ncbi:MAG: hypothetical protein D6737_09510 [Chloroflexi bacterium]|nr:MAG: hypothetical protein D6737_09510 [Chloroflexota bacterium]
MATRFGSILGIDFGNVYTRVVLLDLVDGNYRLVARSMARTTLEEPYKDITIGLKRAVAELSELTGRRLMNEHGDIIKPEQIDRSGVDQIVMTASVGRAMRTVLIGLVPDVSIESGLRATDGTYVEVVRTISLEDDLSDEELLNAILISRPDLIFIVGGTEGGAEDPLLDMARVVRMALSLISRRQKPSVIYAGNSALVRQMRLLFGNLDGVNLFIAPNVRPTLENEQLEKAQLQLALAFNKQGALFGRGLDSVVKQSRLGILPTGQSYDLIVEYLGQTRPKENVVAIDVGSAVTTMSVSIQGETSTTIRTDIGSGHSAHSLLEIVGTEAVRRWLPFYITQDDLESYALNKMLRPASIPQSVQDLYLEYGFVRAGVEKMIALSRPRWPGKNAEKTPSFGMVIGAGAALTQSGRDGYDALVLLDGLQPVGVSALFVDPYGLIPALGAVVRLYPEAVVQILDGANLEQMGTCISASGRPKRGRTALRVKIKLDDGEEIKHDVPGGSIWVYPLGIGQSAEVEVRSGRGLTIGDKGRVKQRMEGGTVGLIFDARGRPLVLPNDIARRAELLPLWISQITGDEMRPIPEELLTPVDEEVTVISAPDILEQLEVAGGQPRRRLKQLGEEEPQPESDFGAFDFDDDDIFAEDDNPFDELNALRDELS